MFKVPQRDLPHPSTTCRDRTASHGAGKAIHVEDDGLHGTDAIGTSLVLAKAVDEAGLDLVITGMASTDGAGGVIPALVAERLRVPQMALLSEVSVENGFVKGRRDVDAASEQLEARLPAVVSVTDQSGEARCPSFKGIMAAKKKPVQSWDLSDLGIEAEKVGLEGAYTAVEGAAKRPARTAGTVVGDEGDGGKQLAEFLASRRFI